MDSERESKLWKNGVFIFDTSAIGALYGLIPSSQEVMMEILNKFADRTWIPAQVLYEYMKNREKMIMNPCKEHYQNPKAVINSNLIDSFDVYLKDFENEDFHPNMSPEALDKLKVFDWDWECMGGYERPMGIENQYIIEHYIDCPKCGDEVHITFNVWEYPVGAYNYSDIEIEGGVLETDFDFQERIKPIFEDDDPVCYKCGRHGNVGEDGLCSECLDEQERILTSDD